MLRQLRSSSRAKSVNVVEETVQLKFATEIAFKIDLEWVVGCSSYLSLQY